MSFSLELIEALSVSSSSTLKITHPKEDDEVNDGTVDDDVNDNISYTRDLLGEITILQIQPAVT